MANEQIQAGFVRNRRFLIAVSIALASASALGLHITELTILGNNAEIQHPEHLVLLAWIVWLWSFAQYIVWYGDVGAWGGFRQAVEEDCSLRLGRIVATEAIPQWLQAQLRNEFKNRVPPTEDDSQIRFVAAFARMHGDGKRIERAADIEAFAYMRLPDQRGEDRTGTIRFEREISASEWRRYMAAASIRCLLTRRFTLEYFAPYLIGLLPVATWALRHFSAACGGSFFRALCALIQA